MSVEKFNEVSVAKLKGLGPKSAETLARVGISSAQDFLLQDPFDIFARLYALDGKANLNLLYAMIGAQQNCHWQEVKQNQRLQILLRLEEMGIATA